MSNVSREKGAIFCPVHQKKKLVFLCKQCNILICNKCMVKEHSGHPVEEVEEVAEKKFQKLDEFITKTEGKAITRVKKDFEQVEGQFNAKRRDLETEIDKAYQHEEYLIELVRKNAKKTVGFLKSELQTINQQFYEIKSESDTYLDDLKSAVNECKETKKTKNDILIIDVVDSVDKLSDNPPSYQIPQNSKKFTHGSNPVVDIEKAYGCVSTDGDTAVGFQRSKDKPKPVHPTSRSEKTQDLHPKGAAAPIKNRQLLPQPQVTRCKDLKSRYPRSLEKFSNGTLCYFCYDEPNVYLVDKSFDIKEIKLDVSVQDIAIHPTTDVLYIVWYSDRSIRIVDIRTGTTSIVFTTVDKPYCMSFTGDGTILVGFYWNNKVVNYTMRGIVLKSVSVTDPWHISVCDITGNIVIASRDAGAVVMNKDLQTVFVYTGRTKKQQSENALDCRDAVFDTEGHILVDDCDNKEVHIVNANSGNHLSTINLDKFGLILSLCVNHDGGLVVGTDKPNQLVFVKYM